jgi:hypothetical protein
MNGNLVRKDTRGSYYGHEVYFLQIGLRLALFVRMEGASEHQWLVEGECEEVVPAPFDQVRSVRP